MANEWLVRVHVSGLIKATHEEGYPVPGPRDRSLLPTTLSTWHSQFTGRRRHPLQATSYSPVGDSGLRSCDAVSTQGLFGFSTVWFKAENENDE